MDIIPVPTNPGSTSDSRTKRVPASESATGNSGASSTQRGGSESPPAIEFATDDRVERTAGLSQKLAELKAAMRPDAPLSRAQIADLRQQLQQDRENLRDTLLDTAIGILQGVPASPPDDSRTT